MLGSAIGLLPLTLNLLSGGQFDSSVAPWFIVLVVTTCVYLAVVIFTVKDAETTWRVSR
jgi:hypothetical protein